VPRNLLIKCLLCYKLDLILQVLKIAKSEAKVFIIMEFAVTNLHRYLDQRGYIHEDQARKWFGQLASALLYLHKRGVAHRDIKLENILINSKGNIKLCDFGFSKLIESDEGNKPANSTTFCGSLGYCAPEILHRTPYNPWKTDVWSLGVVLYRMVVGAMPFGEGNDLGSVRRITRAQAKVVEFPPFPKTSVACKELIKSLLTVETDRRITLLDIFRSKWVNANPKDEGRGKLPTSATLAKSSEACNNLTIPTSSAFDAVVGETTKPALATPSVISRLRMRLPSLTLRAKK